jgi:hypothetical protein
MLTGSFAFANTSIDLINKIETTNSLSEQVSFVDENIADGCWVYVRFVDGDGNLLGRGRYWDSACTVVGGRGRTIVVASISQ